MSPRAWPGGLAARWSLLALLYAAACGAQSLQPVPKFDARVVDITGTLTAAQQSMLEEKLQEFEARKGSQLAVLIVPTTRPEEIAQYAVRVWDQWKLGRKGIDDGVLLVIAKNDRAMWIATGRGLEGALTDITTSRIISETITPLFREGDFYGGINAGIERLMRVIDGEPLPAPDQGWQGRPQGLGSWLPFLFMALFMGAPLLRALFGRAFGSILTGALTGAVLYLAGQALVIAVLVGCVVLIVSLAGFAGARGWSSYPRAGGWGGGWGTGLGGVGGGFGGSFGAGRLGGGGGFSGGGGGTTAGGGASGRW
jgi:uncharacterized protein